MLGGKPVERSFIRIVCLLMGVGLQGPLQAQPRSTPEELRCLDSGRQAAQIRKDIEEARRLGVQGTPTFFLGVQESGGDSMKVLRVIYGAQPYTHFKEAIEAALRELNR